jgi:phosphate transport system permease protein
VRERGDIKRQTSRAVYLWDRAAGAVISVGGAAVLAAVLGICVFLVWEVVPLFRGGEARAGTAAAVSPAPTKAASLLVLADAAQAAMTLNASGELRAFSVQSGQEFWRSSLGEGLTVTAASVPEQEGLVALALSDGSLRIGSLSLSSRPLRDEELTQALRAIPVGGQLASGQGAEGKLIEHARADQWSETTPLVRLREAVKAGAAPTTRVDIRESASGGRFMVSLSSDGSAAFGTIRTITPLGGGEPTEKLVNAPFSLAINERGPPDWLFVTSDGRHVLALWKNGTLERYATGVGSDAGINVAFAERLAASPDAEVTTAAMLLGGQTLLLGTSKGTVLAYDAARDVTSPAPDGMRLVKSGEFRVGNQPIDALATGERDRIVAAADRAGAVLVRHMTSRKTIAQVNGAPTASGARIAFTPAASALIALDGSGGYRSWSISTGHANAGLASLFAPIMYEGEVKPRFIYQSSSGSDASEIKLSLVPLIFGTLKATVVGMLVAVPLAVLGAIYSSEFMHKRIRRVVKPTVEMMASLPSVVLGFIAAMVVAPFMRDWLPQVLSGLLLTAVFLVFFAYLWQLLPRRAAAAVTRRARMLLVGGAVMVSIVLACATGPVLERWLFRPTHADALVAAGSFTPVPKEQWPAWVGNRDTMSPDEERRLRRDDLYFRAGSVVRPLEAAVSADAAGAPGIQRWLDGSIGNATPGWLAALFLPVLLGLSYAQARIINRERFEQVLGAGPAAMAAAELVRFLLVIAAGIGITYALAHLFTGLGWDTRDWIFGPYSQRNSLVVGVIMGFAVIPLVYTISEDALRSVPNSLRSASLGVGATPWQTAVRVVLPAAGSGVFSAIMIGLGRAVGETMIVLMAAGNTPEISSNIFSGFRTLAANIAVELPEAENGSTHYRVLFLCGFVLFAMTFVINTTAEVVRQRFRKRNAAL